MRVSIVPRYRQLLTLAWCQGFLKQPSQHYLAFLCARSKTGNKVAASHQARQRPFSGSPNAIPRFCKSSLSNAVRPNPAVDPVRFALWTLRDEAAQRR